MKYDWSCNNREINGCRTPPVHSFQLKHRSLSGSNRSILAAGSRNTWFVIKHMFQSLLTANLQQYQNLERSQQCGSEVLDATYFIGEGSILANYCRASQFVNNYSTTFQISHGIPRGHMTSDSTPLLGMIPCNRQLFVIYAVHASLGCSFVFLLIGDKAIWI